MKIARVLNNNIAVAVNDRGDDVIVMGCGVAYQKRHGDDVDEAKVERLFTQHISELSRRLSEMVNEIPEEYFEAAREVIDNAKMHLGSELDDSLYLSLTDHIHFAVERARRGIRIHNRLLIETKMIYEEEFRESERAVTYLNSYFDVDLPQDEAAFIALHLVNAGTGVSMDETVEITKMVQEVVTIIRNYFRLEFEPDSLDYYRLMVHLKFFAKRVVSEEEHSDELENRQLFSLIQEQYEESYRCAERVADFVGSAYRYTVSDDEKMYLAIHIERIRSRGDAARRPGRRTGN